MPLGALGLGGTKYLEGTARSQPLMAKIERAMLETRGPQNSPVLKLRRSAG